MVVYDVFGFSLSDLEQVREALEKSLDVKFEPHESSFRDEYYLYQDSETGQELMLESNVDPEEGGPLYLEFSEFPTVLHVSETDRDEKLATLRGAIAGCKLLKHREMPEEA